MAYKFDEHSVAQAAELAAQEGFTSLASLKKNEAYTKVENSFARHMKAAGVKIMRLVISIPEPKKYEYTVTPAGKLDAEDFKFVWQILRGTNSYKDGVPKWNICSIQVVDGHIKSVDFKQGAALVRRFRKALGKTSSGNKHGVETLDSIMTRMEILDAEAEMGACIEGYTRIWETIRNVDQAMSDIQKHGDAAVEAYGVDGCWEDIGCSVENLQRQTAIVALSKSAEGLGEAALNKAKEFIKWLKEWVAKIVQFFKDVFARITGRRAVVEKKLVECKKNLGEKPEPEKPDDDKAKPVPMEDPKTKFVRDFQEAAAWEPGQGRVIHIKNLSRAQTMTKDICDKVEKYCQQFTNMIHKAARKACTDADKSWMQDVNSVKELTNEFSSLFTEVDGSASNEPMSFSKCTGLTHPDMFLKYDAEIKKIVDMLSFPMSKFSSRFSPIVDNIMKTATGGRDAKNELLALCNGGLNCVIRATKPAVALAQLMATGELFLVYHFERFLDARGAGTKNE